MSDMQRVWGNIVGISMDLYARLDWQKEWEIEDPAMNKMVEGLDDAADVIMAHELGISQDEAATYRSCFFGGLFHHFEDGHYNKEIAELLDTLGVDTPERLWCTLESVKALDEALEEEEDEFVTNAKIAFEDGDLNNFYKADETKKALHSMLDEVVDKVDWQKLVESITEVMQKNGDLK
jgi:hypothetical protein